MTFDPNAQLDPSQVTDVRGSSRIGGRGGGLAVGGGGLGLVIAIIYVLLGGNPGDLLGGGSGGGTRRRHQRPRQSRRSPTCKTGADANQREDCQIVGYVNSIQAFWATQVQGYSTPRPCSSRTACRPAAATRPHRPGRSTARSTRTSTSTSASSRSSRTGSARRTRRSPGPTSSPTSTATTSRICSAISRPAATTPAPTGRSVRTELQADCYAGVWAHNAAATGFIQPLTPDQIARPTPRRRPSATTTSSSRRRAGSIPDSFTHGTSEQRVHWFTRGYQSGKPGDCDTFNAQNL